MPPFLMSDRLREQVYDLLIERLLDAVEGGELEGFDLDWLPVILEVQFPEEYREPGLPRLPTKSPPASVERATVYAERFALKQALYHPDDLSPEKNERLSLVIKAFSLNQWAAPKVEGWSEE